MSDSEEEVSQSSKKGKYLPTDFSRRNFNFAFHLYNKLIEDKEPNNIIISPLSVQIAATLCFLGASGDTAAEMVKGLHLCSDDVLKVADSFKNILDMCENNGAVCIANKIYVNKNCELNPEFHEMAVKNFYSEAESIDFAKPEEAAKAINSWVKNKTKKIKSLVDAKDLDGKICSILLNAIYFKAPWLHPFEKKRSFPGKFWVTESESVDVIFMRQKYEFNSAQIHDSFSDLEANIVELPFTNCNLSMWLILPGKREHLSLVEERLRERDVVAALSSQLYPCEVEVTMPRFKLELSVKLKECFMKMGMKKMFTPEAEFTTMLKEADGIFVDEIVHKAFIYVDEEGAEAGAATECRDVFMSGPDIMDLRRPFIYLIVDNECNVLFLGKLYRPKRAK